MQCPICGFENISGQETCARCHTLLKVTKRLSPEDLTPPRAARGRIVRRLSYFLNRVRESCAGWKFSEYWRAVVGTKSLPGEALAAILASVLPGFGHLLTGRTARAGAAFGVWVTLAILTANFYHGAPRTLLVGCLVGWHAVVLFDAGRVNDHLAEVLDRLRVMAPVLLLTAASYYGITVLIGHYFMFLETPTEIRALSVKSGDVLRFRRGTSDIRRGEVVAHSFQGGYFADGRWVRTRYYANIDVWVMGIVTALSRDEVTVGPDGVVVNGSPVDPGTLPAQHYPFPRSSIAFEVPSGQVMVVSPVNPNEYVNQNLADDIWRMLYCVPEADVYGRAVSVYLPLLRRHTLDRTADE